MISLQDFKEISEYFVGIIRDTVPDENVSDEIYEKRILMNKIINVIDFIRYEPIVYVCVNHKLFSISFCSVSNH